MQFAAGSTDITPGLPVPLAASGHVGDSLGIASRLEANAIAIHGPSGPVVLVSADLLYVGGDLRGRLLKRFAGRLRAEQLFIAASHTHFGPATSATQLLGEVRPEYIEFAAAEMGDLIDRLLEAAAEDGTFTYGASRASHSVNRRRRRLPVPVPGLHTSRRVHLLPNVRGERDETVRTVAFRTHDGQLRCVLWSYACHPVCFPDESRVSAEYPGYVRRALRTRFGEDLPVLFFQGFSGDTRPRAIQSNSVEGQLRTLLNLHEWHRYTPGEWEEWADSLAQVVVRSMQAESETKRDEAAAANRLEDSLAWALDSPDAAARLFTLHQVSLGTALRIIGVSAEPVVGYVRRLRHLMPPGPVIPVGCIDETFGYLPTEAMLSEGGYEVTGFFRGHGLTGALRPGLEARFLQRVAALVFE